MTQLLPLLIWALVPSALGSMTFLGFPSPNTGVCGQPYSVQLVSGFTQVCQANSCPTVSWSISPGLEVYGLYLNSQTGILSGTLAQSAPTTIATTVTAIEGTTNAATGAFQLTVSCPSIFTGTIPDQNAKSGSTLTLNLANYFTIPQGGVTWSLEGAAGSSQIVSSAISQAGVLSITPNSIDTQLQPYRVRIVANSGTTRAMSNYFYINVATAGPQLVGTIPSQTATEGVAFTGSYSVYFRDPDQYTLSYSLKVDGQPLNTVTSGLVFNSQSGFLSGTPSTSFAGFHTLTVCAANNRGSAEICQTPTSFNVGSRTRQAPQCGTITPLNTQTTMTVSIDLAAVCRDPAGLPLTFALQNPLPVGSGLSLAGSNLIGTFNNVDAANSPLRLVIVVTNTDQLSTTTTAQITLTVRNNPPVLTAFAGQAQMAYTLKAFTFSVKTWFSDQDFGDILTYTITPNLPLASGLRFYNGDFSGTPNDFDVVQGLYTFTVSATDSRGVSVSSVLYITVLKGNHPPTTIALTGQPPASLGTSWQWNINPFFADQDGDRLTYTLTGQPVGSGLVSISGDGILRGTFNQADQVATRNQPVTVTITADDQKGGTVTNQFSYTVIVPPQCVMPLSSEVPLAYLGAYWNFTVSQYCSSTGRVTYSLQQLHSGNNFVINTNTGLISGIISQADMNKGSFNVVYSANDGTGGVTNNSFTVFVVKSTAPIVIDCSTPAICYTGYNCGQQGSACFNGQGETLVYSMTGQPIGSMLRIDRFTGVISGQVTAVDAAASQPIHLIVTADNQKGGVSTKDLYYTIQFPQPVTLKALPPDGFPDVICGMQCCGWNPRDYVSNPSNGRVNYNLTSAFPTGSQIRLLPTGDFAGVASVIDVRASPLNFIISVANDMPTAPVLLSGSFRVVGNSAPQAIAGRPLPATTIKVRNPWRFDVSSYFKIPTDVATRYTMSGAPTSLIIDENTGVITGTLLDTDYLRPTQTVTITADNSNDCGGGALSLSFVLTVDPDNKAPIAVLPTNVAPLQACEGADFKVCVCDWFSDPKNLRLTYSISGLANGTKLVLVPSTGLLSGRTGPDDTDGTGQSITVCATNTIPLTTCITRQVSFDRGQRAPQADPPIPSPVTALVGQRFVGYFNFHFFETDGQPLIYSVAGLPPGSGMGIGPITGIFSGIPNEADFRASPLVLSVFASNEQNPPAAARCLGSAGRARADFIAIIEKPKGNPICNPIPITKSVMQLGQFWVLDVARYFEVGSGATKLEFAIRGLPRGSGLSIDPRSGIISGIISTSDLSAQPLSFLVAATNGYGQCQSLVTTSASPSVVPIQQCPINAQNIPNQNAMANRYFTVDLSTFFQSIQRLPLVFALNGLPQGSGFIFNQQTGVLSGTSSFADLNAGTISLVISVKCGGASQPITKQLNLIISSCNGCQNNGGCAQRCIIQDTVSCRPVCSCDNGILGPDGRSCQSGNVCDANNGGCEKFCSVFNGAPVCSCPPNWNLAPDGRGCQYNACGSNNGGCEQLCIAVGQSLKCDCRSGTLQSDGRSCSSGLVTLGTIPPALVIGCQYFVFDFSTAVKYTGRGSLTYSMVGTPSGSGFKITSAGMLSGTPTSADCGVSQPMTLTISATDGASKVSAVMFMSAFCEKPSACPQQQLPQVSSFPALPASLPSYLPSTTVPNYLSAPAVPSYLPASALPSSTLPAPSIPLLWAVVCVAFKFDVTPFFPNVQAPAQYVCLGLAPGTGLSMNSGVLSGTPNTQDCSMAPMTLTILCNDAAGRQTKTIVNIKFLSCDCATAKPLLPAPMMSMTTFSAPAAPLYSHTSCRCGEPFFYDTSNMFANQFQVNSLQYSVSGLPKDSGLYMTDSGVLSGAPNSNILQNANPLRAKVTGTDQYGKAMNLVLTIQVSGDCGGLVPQTQSTGMINARSSLARPAADENEGLVPMQIARRGMPFTLNVSRITFCANCDNSPIEYRANLPVSSGLIFRNGAFSGTPSAADCIAQPQPYPINVTTWQKGSQKASVKILISFACDNTTASVPVLNGALPEATGVVSSLFYYNAAPLMSGASALSFSVFGIATSSDLKMSTSGVLSGVPSEVDINGPPLLVTATDALGNFVQATLKLNVAKSGTASSIIFLPLKPVQANKGQYFQLNVAQRFYDQTGHKISVSLDGIVRGSGMAFDSQMGVLSGTPNDNDILQYQPVRFLLTARSSANETKKGEVYINFVTDQPQKLAILAAPSDMNRAPVSTPLKRQIATEGEPFLFGVSSSFFDQDGDLLTFSLEDVPEGTGLRIDPIAGIISGTPTRSDSLSQQPLHIIVAATDSNGLAVAETFLLTVFQGTRRSVNRVPVASQIDSVIVATGKNFTVALASNFADADGDILTYSISGLPKQSGCRISSSGTLEGTPSSVDLIASPMILLVSVSDGIDHVQATFNFIVVDNKGQNRPPTSKAMPQLRLSRGDSLRFAAKQYFTDPDGTALTFQVVGLPKGTGFVVDPATGILSGVPTSADFSAKQPIVAGFVANDGQGGRAGEVLYIRLDEAGYRSIQESDFSLEGITKSVVQAGVPQMTLEVGTWVLFNARQYFPSYGDSGVNVAYSIRGLPLGSGLQINSGNGVISGTANAVDAGAARSQTGKALPVTIVCTFKMGQTSDPVEQVILLKFDSDNGRNHEPLAQTIPAASLRTTGDVLVNAWTSFSDPDGDVLTFSVVDLPKGSGLSMISSSGVLFGIPSPADLASPQPLVLTVVCDDSRGGKVQEVLMLDVSKTAATVIPPKTCQELGWAVNSQSTGCSRSAKVAGVCPLKTTYDEANAMCAGLGARMCSSQELMDRRIQDSSECSYDDLLWTSSSCAFGDEVLTQGRRTSLGRSCENKTTFTARMVCCADSRPVKVEAPVLVAKEAVVNAVNASKSAKTCEELPTFVVEASSRDRGVCSTAKPTKAKCAPESTFEAARAMCQGLGARLCSSKELDQHLALDGGCAFDNKRVWSSSTCPNNQMSSQAGSPSNSLKFPKKCTAITEKLPFHCCADFEQGEGFDQLQVSPDQRSAQIGWTFGAYPLCRVSYQKVVDGEDVKENQWLVPSGAKQAISSSGGKFGFQLTELQPGTNYIVRVVPLKKVRNQVTEVRTQLVEFSLTTSKA